MKISAHIYRITLAIALFGGICSHATEYVWNNSTGNNNYMVTANWDTPIISANTSYAAIDLTGANKSIFSSGSSLNIAGLHIGYNSGDGEFEQTGGTLTATKHSSAASRIGNGHTGSWTMTGGTASINAIQLGFNNGTGNLIISNGTMVIARGASNYSLMAGSGGTGHVEIHGGSFVTRTGLFLGNGSTFAVYGSAASSIGIGSHGTVDGRWVQEAGGILKSRIDTGGITLIFIDDTGSSGSEDGNVTFADGALLDVDFLGASQQGSWDVMKWEGTLTDYGLAFAPDVDPAAWSFEFVDTDASGTPDTLRVKTEQTVMNSEYAYDANAANVPLPAVADAYSDDASTNDHINVGQKFLAADNGYVGLNDGTIALSASFSAADLPATATYTLDTNLNATGYEINAITTLAGRENNGANLANQNYEVWISTVGSSDFSLLHTVDYTPFTSTNLNGNTAATKVSLTNSGGVLADRVDQIRFVFLDDGQSFGSSDGTVYQEIDVYSSTLRPRLLYVSRMFDDAMVLQRDLDVPIWGTVIPGGEVTIQLDGNTVATATADSSGKWMARIGSHPGDGGLPHTLTISSPDEEDIVLMDVVFGDVYICSGQSNMARTLAGVNNNSEIAIANHPLIRQIAMEMLQSSTEYDVPPVVRTWTASSPATAGNFCAVGYYFAKQVQATTGEPVGLLFSAYGGRQIQRFVNAEGMAAVPALSGVLQNIENGKIGSYYDIYNAMIAPMVPYGVRGAIWYQGEQDAGSGDGDIYQFKMRALIRGWRNKWAQDNFSFYSVQLCNFITTADWPILRAAQLRSISEPDTGMAVSIDVGNDNDIHPTNKKDVGNRLASWALAKELGYETPYSSPLIYATAIEGDQIRVLFDHADGGLMVGTKNGENPVVETTGALQNFEIAGSNKVFAAATATIDADTVLVSAPSVTEPLYVRYCYANAPTGGNKLYNRAGFPASPFRTDAAYELEVYAGSGSATEQVEGTTIAITADAPAGGMVFDRWIGAASAVADLNASSTTVSMPDHDLYLMASYRSNTAATYSITVNNGYGGGISQAGSIINIEAQAAPAGEVFEQWSGDTQTVVNVYAADTTFRMPDSNIALTAVYKTIDSVGDGIPDEWRAAYFGGNGASTNDASAASADPDSDEMTNHEEFDAGSNPTNGLSVFEISAFEVSSTDITLGFTAFEGHRYTLESTSSLTTGSWETVLHNVTGDGQFKQNELDTANGAFFRARSKE